MDGFVNWLVQGLIVALSAACGLRLMSGSPAAARHGLVWAAYLLVLSLPALSWVPLGSIDETFAAVASIPTEPVLTMPAVWWTSAAVATGLWIIWSCVHVIRFIAAVVALRRARRDAHPCPADLLIRLPHWSRINRSGRPTRVVLSNDVPFAAVLGCGSPLIGLAPNLIDRLSAADLDRVLVHEWAHVQRRDDVMQMVQRMVRTVVGWHPAAWWLERQLEFEREAACDAVAVTVTGSVKEYAACLVTLAALPRVSVRALPAPAALSSGFRRRVVRILALPSCRRGPLRRVATVGAAAALAALTFAAANVRAVEATRFRAALPIAARPPAVAIAEDLWSATHDSVVWGTPLTPTVSSAAAALDRPEPAASRNEAGSAPTESPAMAPHAALEIATPTLPARSTDWGPLPSITAGVPMRVANGADRESAPLLAESPREGGEIAPWTSVANAGIAVGRSSQKAGVATAGLFTRLGRRVTRSF